MEFDVITYNIRLGIDSSIGAIADAIKTEGVPDIIALQEIGLRWQMGECIDQPQALGDALGLHAHFCGALTDKNNGQFGIALLSRYPIVHCTKTELPRITDEQRVLLEAHIQAPVPLTVFTSHFSIHESERQQHASFLAQRVTQCKTPVIALGDFNARPTTPEYRTLTEQLTDAFAHRGVGPAETFSVAEPHRQIDYIMSANGAQAVGSCKVLRHIQTSDHFPLAARIRALPHFKPAEK